MTRASLYYARLSKYGGVTFDDPFNNVSVRWHPAAWKVKPLTARSTSGGFTFYIAAPESVVDGEFRVHDRKMRDCIAPRLVHMLDAALNALVIEQLASVAKPGMTFAAIHDAWLLAPLDDDAVDFTLVPDEAVDDLAEITEEPRWTIRGTRLLRWALREATREWFASLEPVYDDLICYLEGTPYSAFAHKIKARWRQRLDDCRTGRAEWPRFRLG